MTFTEIIEREFRAAVNAPADYPVHVEFNEDETIMVTYHRQTYLCDCSGDDTFVFIDQRGNELIITIPADWFEAHR